MDETLKGSIKDIKRYIDGDPSQVDIESVTVPVYPKFTGANIKAIFARVGKYYHWALSYSDIAMIMGVPAETVSEWVTDQKHPAGSSARLLQVIKADPSIIKKAL